MSVGTRATTPAWDPEVQLLLRAYRAPFNPPAEASRACPPRRAVRWDRLTQLAAVHGVLSLLDRHLRAAPAGVVPADVLDHLAEQFYATAGANAFLAAALARLLRAFAAQGVRAVPFKGPTLAVSAYGDLALRHPGDLDILVPPADAPAARDLLVSWGYVPDEYRDETEQHFVSGDGRVNVDLHWRLAAAHFRPLTPPAAWWRRLRSVHLSGTTVPYFAAEECLLLLCLNATKRLGRVWLGNVCDIAAQLGEPYPVDWARVMRQACRLGCRRLVCAGLLLAHDVVGAPLPGRARRWARGCFGAQTLADGIRGTLFREAPVSRAAWFLHKVRAAERPGDCLAALKFALVPSPRDRGTLPLPSTLSFLHYGTRPFRLLREHGGQVLALARP